jgi:hypothetical protein
VRVVLGTGLGEPVESFESEKARCKKDKSPDDRSYRGVQLKRLAEGIACKTP